MTTRRHFIARGIASPSSHVASSATVETRGAHELVRVWSRGGLAGELLVSEGDGARLADALDLQAYAGDGARKLDVDDVEQHRARHQLLHQFFDELVADWISHTGSLPSKSTVMELLTWSAQQTRDPSPTPPNLAGALIERAGKT